MGKVYLVGAGCGSLDLYTVKAMRCIQKADCLIYDHLIDEEILEYCPIHCELIYVGKKAHHHTMKQEEINELLVKKSRQYNYVVRLKGGDVYVFGRGGEEAKLLYENHIDFEVVPGVSSAIAGLDYAGIPITHRGISGGFQVYTAQLRYQENRDFDYTKMLDDYCTYVFLMGIAKIDMIINGLIAAGKRKETPVAVISHASMADQQCLVGTLEDICNKFHSCPLPTPGIIVVGNVIEMRKYLNFYERLPLFSKKILITTIGNDHYLKNQLIDLGAYVNEVKTGEVVYQDVNLPDMKGYIIFTSQHGVIGFMKNYLNQYKDLRNLSRVKIICIGARTNKKLNEYGLNADFIASVPDSNYINREFKELVKDSPTYLITGGQKSNVTIQNHDICVYHNQEVNIQSNIEHYDYALFTCASSVKRFFKANTSICDCFISIGAHTTQAILECYGDVRIIEVKQSTKKAMIETVLNDIKER